AHGLRVTLGGIDDIRPARPYDAVVVYNTFEQLYDPAAVLRSAHRVLRPGGVLSLRVPNGTFYRRWRARPRGPPPRAQQPAELPVSPGVQRTLAVPAARPRRVHHRARRRRHAGARGRPVDDLVRRARGARREG